MPKLRFPGFEGEWENTELGNLVVYGKDKTRVTKNHYVSTENIEQDFRGIIPFEDAETIVDGTEFTKGDVLIANIRPYLKKVWQSNMYGACNADVLVMKPQEIDNDFLYNLIAQNRFIDYVMGGVKGSKMPRGDKAHILQYNTAVPSIVEQRQIARFLSLLSNRITMQKKLIETLKKYKRGVMRDIFRDKDILYSKETKWNSVRLGDECTFFSGGTPKSNDSSYYGGAIPFIRSGEIHGEKTELFLTDAGLKNSSAKMVSKGDLIVALYGATSGEVDISKIDGAINQAILCIRPAVINKIFLKYLLEDSKENILNIYLQGGQGNLSAEIIKNLVFDIPDVRSQASVAYFLSIIDRRINSLLVCLEKLTALRSGMMQQLFI